MAAHDTAVMFGAALLANAIVTPEGTYVPWTDGHAVGYRVTDDDGRDEFIYLNPSSDDSDGEPNVFVYRGPHGDPSQDQPLHFYRVLT